MYSIILGIALGAVLGLVVYKFHPRRETGSLAGSIFGAIIVGGVGGVLAALTIGGNLPWVDQTINYQLAAMRAVDNVSGVFVWDSGNIGTQRSYVCMILRDDGSFEPWSTPPGSTIRIRELPDLKSEGRLIIHYKTKKTDTALAGWALGTRSEGADYIYEFDVPVGSVVHQFKAN